MKYKLLFYSTFLMSSVSYSSGLDVLCGDGYNSYEKVKGSKIITIQKVVPVDLPTNIRPEVAYNTGISINVPMHCGLVSNKRISGYKSGSDRAMLDRRWTPFLRDPNTALIKTPNRAQDAPEYFGDTIIDPRYRTFANRIDRNLVIRLKDNVTEIPANTYLLTLEIYSRVDLSGGRDVTFHTYIPIHTRKRVTIQKPTCDFSTANSIVNLKPFNNGISTSQSIPISIRCNLDSLVHITLKGQAESGYSSILKNTATNNPAKGIGFKILDTNGNELRLNTARSYQLMSNQNNFLFRTDYAPVGSSTVKAGNVQSVVDIQMQYN